MFKQIAPGMIAAITVFLIMLTICVVVVSTSYYYMDGAYQDRQSATRAMQKWKTKINSSVANNQIIEKFEENFLKLINQGVVGSEDRLSWFETLQNAAKKRGMPLVKYSISSQEALKENNLIREYSGINVFKSIMKLDITMAHEGDLFALLNDLNKADGLYTVDKCNIEKTNVSTVGTNNMRAYCELGWYTFRGANTGQAAADNIKVANRSGG